MAARPPDGESRDPCHDLAQLLMIAARGPAPNGMYYVPQSLLDRCTATKPSAPAPRPSRGAHLRLVPGGQSTRKPKRRAPGGAA